MTFVNDLKSSPHVIIFFAQETHLSFLWRDLGNNPIAEIKRTCMHAHTHTHTHTHTQTHFQPVTFVPYLKSKLFFKMYLEFCMTIKGF